jgi:hypothetical protein
MECRQCSAELDRVGDFCLRCRTGNADAVVCDCGRERATVTALRDGERIGAAVVTTTPEEDATSAAGVVELRNFAGRIADEVHRKRPEDVYAAGERAVLTAVRERLHHELYRVDGEDPVAAAIERRDEPALEVVEAAPAEKIGGTHSTLVGGRTGETAIATVAGHPNVKKIVPGPIEAGGSAGGGVRVKATRAGERGNVRLLVRDGSSVQENRVVTTARDRETGERVRAALNEALAEAELR